MKYQAVLFDLDGTLLDTAMDIMGACNHTLEKYGYKAVSEALLRTKVTAGMREMLKLGVPKDKWESSGIETFMREEFSNYYSEHIADKTIPFEGIEELVTALENNGIKTGVITNKYLTHSKPHPEPILKALEMLKVNAQETIYIGDHLNDITAANAAHVDSAIAMWGYGMNECKDVNLWGATYKTFNVKELSKLILS